MYILFYKIEFEFFGILHFLKEQGKVHAFFRFKVFISIGYGTSFVF